MLQRRAGALNEIQVCLGPGLGVLRPECSVVFSCIPHVVLSLHLSCDFCAFLCVGYEIYHTDICPEIFSLGTSDMVVPLGTREIILPLDTRETLV